MEGCIYRYTRRQNSPAIFPLPPVGMGWGGGTLSHPAPPAAPPRSGRLDIVPWAWLIGLYAVFTPMHYSEAVIAGFRGVIEQNKD